MGAINDQMIDTGFVYHNLFSGNASLNCYQIGSNFESFHGACIGILGIQDICHFYFQRYRILSILLPVIWDTVLIIFVTFRDIKY